MNVLNVLSYIGATGNLSIKQAILYLTERPGFNYNNYYININNDNYYNQSSQTKVLGF